VVVYADASLVVSLYIREAHSEAAVAALSRLDSALRFTSLLRHEVFNALRLAAFRGDITLDTCRDLIADIEADQRRGLLLATPLPWDLLFDEAERLSAGHTAALGLRSLDLLHVAAARLLGAELFLTFDRRQRKLAEKAGLKTGP
jgi:predicted nucleic acid-binding protein